MCKLNGIYAVIGRTCGAGQLVPVDCGDPLCPECEKRRSSERREHWKPVFTSMRSPRMITLTIKSGDELKERIKVLQSSFRRLLDYRLGPRNLKLIKGRSDAFLELHLSKLVTEGTINELEATRRLITFRKYINRFEGMINRYKQFKTKWPRMRDVIGPGFATLEITHNQDTAWHVHRHLCVDGQFIPWAVLVCVWRIVTNNEGEIVDVRSMDNSYERSINEVTKYLAKPWDIPNDKKDEFRSAVRGIKRIWPLGGAKPVIVDPICPFCGDPACKGRMLDTGEAFKQGMIGETKVMFIRSLSGKHEWVFALVVGAGWRSIPLDLIPKDFAWQSLSENSP